MSASVLMFPPRSPRPTALLTNRIIHGNCMEIMKGMPSESVDLIVTDPPFMQLREMEIHRRINPQKYKTNVLEGTITGMAWDSYTTLESYLNFTENWFSQSARVLKKGGHLTTFFDRLKFTYLAEFCEKYGMLVRQGLFWILKNPVPRAGRFDFMNAVAPIFWATKGTRSRKFATFNCGTTPTPNYRYAPICGGKQRQHPTQKPQEIIEWLVEYLTNEGDLVLDPFVGSGTTAVACRLLNRNYIGIEISDEYCKIAESRLKNIPSRPEAFAEAEG